MITFIMNNTWQFSAVHQHDHTNMIYYKQPQEETHFVESVIMKLFKLHKWDIEKWNSRNEKSTYMDVYVS